MHLCSVYNLKLVRIVVMMMIIIIIIIVITKENCLSQLRVFIMNMKDLFTTCFGPKGLSSDDTYIKITKTSYYVMSCLHTR